MAGSERCHRENSEVAAGNEKAWEFYEKYGFLPRKTILKQVRNSNSRNQHAKTQKHKC